MTGYVVVIEEGPESFGAYSPDLPGVVAAAETRDECERLIRKAIVFHSRPHRGRRPGGRAETRRRDLRGPGCN